MPGASTTLHEDAENLSPEWLRRRDPVLDRHLRKFLFREGSIVEHEEPAAKK